jgi:hypothetical protein
MLHGLTLEQMIAQDGLMIFIQPVNVLEEGVVDVLVQEPHVAIIR